MPPSLPLYVKNGLQGRWFPVDVITRFEFNMDAQEDRPASGAMLERVLVVDDVALNREILRSHIDGVARHADEAGDGHAALALFKQYRYDAILLDIEMPGMDGCETLIEMRAWEREQRLPSMLVVAVTSSDFPEDEQRILAAGATTYLVKPVQRHALLAALQVDAGGVPSGHPMARLIPQMFASASALLDEIEMQNEPEAVSERLHQLRGMIAVYGYPEFADRLRQVHSAVSRGEMPKPAEWRTLREELQLLKAGMVHP